MNIYIYIYIHVHNEFYHVYIPQTDLSVGVLTVLYKGPCLVAGNVARAARKICL